MNRPYVICHMCTTIDGKILSNRWGKLPGRKTSSGDLFETTAASFGIGAWIVGTTTMREFSGRDFKLKRAKSRIAPDDHIANPTAKRLAIGLDAKAALRFQKNEVDGDHVVLCITNRASQNYRAHLQHAGVSYLICGQRDINLHTALKKLHQHFNLKNLMAQGGGKFNGSMLREGLIDQISHIIVPIADGGQAIPTFFDATNPVPKKSLAKLKLMSLKKLPGDVHWFRYRVVGHSKKH